MKIAVLFGGTSEERDVSIASAAQIVPALRSRGHDVFAVDTATGRILPSDEPRLLIAHVDRAPPTSHEIAVVCERAVTACPAMFDVRAADIVFLALHGGAGEDGRIQAMLDLAGATYTGSNHIASAAAMDKDLSKRLFRSAEVPTPDWLMAPATAEEVDQQLGWPVVVKPNKQGSTVGLSVVRTPSQLNTAVAVASEHDDEVMIEKYVPGRELTVAILEGAALPVGEIIASGEVFDYESEYQPGAALEIFPADLSASETASLQACAIRAHAVLKLGAYSRVDFRLDDAGRIWCLEANSLPGMTATSLLPQAAKTAGIAFSELLERICRAALKPR